MAAVLLFHTPVGAQERLFEGEPYDRITLNEQNDNAVLEIKPLETTVRRRVPNLRPSEKLTVYLLEQPETPYEIEWHSIARVELFEQIVLAEASQLVAAGKLDEAYDYFHFLETNYPKLPGLAKATEDYLYEDAKDAQRQKAYDRALVMLRELYGRNPKRPGLDKALGVATDNLVAEYLAKENYRAARSLLQNLAAWFPDQPLMLARQNQLQQQAAALLAEVRQAIRAGELSTAGQRCRRLVRIWPELPGARQLAESIHQKYPRVVVGVSVPAVDHGAGLWNDWAARRSSRLAYRTLTEFAGAGPEGGTYNCPLGQKSVDTMEGRLSFRIRPDIQWSTGNGTLTGYDVSRQLLAMADPGDPAYRDDWAELLGGVAVRGVYQVDVDLRQAHVRPDALLQTVVVPYAARSLAQTNLGNGPYATSSQTDQETVYLANARYFAASPGQPRELVERHYPRGADAIRALKRGEIHLLDRLNPWNRDAVAEDENLELQPYRLPLVHCLIPNMRRPLTSHRAFRRALVYGIHRQAILDQLTGGALPPGCGVLSGPFPSRVSSDEPIDYAYDEQIGPRKYEPRLAVALAGLSLEEVAEAAKQKGRALKEMPSLVLAHPASEIARVACMSIQRQLKLVGIPVELRELQGPLPGQIPATVDLLYAELAIWEPISDAPRLLGADGMSAGCSPYMSLALHRLQQADRWTEIHDASGRIVHRGARNELRKIHRIAHDDVAVVPLWQLTDYVAYRKTLGGLGTQPVSLYQNVEQWRLAFEYPTDEP